MDKEMKKALADTKKVMEAATLEEANTVVREELTAIPAKVTKKAPKMITVLAFTNMVIGTFPVTKQTAKTITVVTAKGAELVFDKETGKQTNAKNPSFANKIQK